MSEPTRDSFAMYVESAHHAEGDTAFLREMLAAFDDMQTALTLATQRAEAAEAAKFTMSERQREAVSVVREYLREHDPLPSAMVPTMAGTLRYLLEIIDGCADVIPYAYTVASHPECVSCNHMNAIANDERRAFQRAVVERDALRKDAAVVDTREVDVAFRAEVEKLTGEPLASSRVTLHVLNNSALIMRHDLCPDEPFADTRIESLRKVYQSEHPCLVMTTETGAMILVTAKQAIWLDAALAVQDQRTVTLNGGRRYGKVNTLRAQEGE